MVRRGEVFGMNTTVMLILVLVSAIGFAAFLTVSSGGMQTLLKGVCEKNPQLSFCAGEAAPEAFESEVARKSTEALVCAVNSVNTGSQWSGGGAIQCSDYYNTAGKVVSQEDYTETTVEISKSSDCNKACMDDQADLCKGLSNCKVTGGAYLERSWLGLDNLKRDRCECLLSTSTRPYFECTGTPIQDCTVSNFMLPQTVTAKEDWIPYFGDPKFIVYWQTFPLSEDTWTFHDAWWMYAIVIGVGALPIGSWGSTVVKAGVKEGAVLTKDAIARGASKVAAKVAEYRSGVKVITHPATIAARKSALKQEVTTIEKQAQKDVMAALRKDMFEKASSPILPQNAFKQGGKFVAIAGGGSVSLAAAEVFDSWLAKLDTYNNQILLKQAGSKTPMQFPVEQGKPVVLQYKDGTFSKSTPTLMLASPCFISTMKVTKEANTICERYVRDTITGDISCDGASLKSGSYASCSSPESYLTKKGGTSDERAEDPIVYYTLGFVGSLGIGAAKSPGISYAVPGYIDIGDEMSTIIISDKMVVTFNMAQGGHEKGAYVIFDTTGSQKMVPLSKSGESTGTYGGIELTYETLAASVDGVEVRLSFEKTDGSCAITDAGQAKLQTLVGTFGDIVAGGESSVSFGMLDGVGCFGHLEAIGKCEKKDDKDGADGGELDKLAKAAAAYDTRPLIEYDEDNPLVDTKNVLYSYDGGTWRWKRAGTDDTYAALRTLSVSECEELDIGTVHIDIMQGLVGKDYEGGIAVFRSVLSNPAGKDSNGDDTQDDSVEVDYTVNELCGAMNRLADRRVFEDTIGGFRYGPYWSISNVYSSVDDTLLKDANYWIELADTNNDYSVDMIGINNGYENVRNQNVYFIDSGSGFDSYDMRRCRTPSVIVKDVEKVSSYDNNYCFDKPTTREIVLKTAGVVVGTAGMVAAGTVADGAALAVASGLAGGALEVWGDISSKWPDAG
jgi:hypothetical protein